MAVGRPTFSYSNTRPDLKLLIDVLPFPGLITPIILHRLDVPAKTTRDGIGGKWRKQWPPHPIQMWQMLTSYNAVPYTDHYAITELSSDKGGHSKESG